MITGITFGTFDLLYSGYIDMLKEAKSHCDYLVVGLHTDSSVERPEKDEPIQSLYERYSELLDSHLVDEVLIYSTESELEEILHNGNINIRFIGEEYRGQDFTGKLYCHEAGIDIYYSTRTNKLTSYFADSYYEKNVASKTSKSLNFKFLYNTNVKYKTVEKFWPTRGKANWSKLNYQNILNTY
ncbi:adenylyltransferase/cytidyltransferase family protein [Arenibacter sp. BSSL-BM3]|uniref:Adenylyltransferase/cytidyltransferase family protein n=1 Tax=Arenibacter arenosicollis TaxID=2762274 RepID=A0ABR7QQ98_9FLAO|nr:adenylyltransferase/cytidyltransferase family protein [Arenibacter arenosicollis]MBC8769371.1 adenylyltransferase/cytidyltransferase family protein [Arenibacter arenosicollis]